MAQTETATLDNGSAFPETMLQFADGTTATMPTDFKGQWLILLAYRGHW